jgi:hypothetical protein
MVASAVSQANHIPQPPQDVEFMETGSLSGLGGTEGGTVEGLDLGMDDNDVMDALFGEDNMDGGVAEGGGFCGADVGEMHCTRQPLEDGNNVQPQPEGGNNV